MIGGGMMDQHVLQMAPRADLVADIMFGCAQPALAELPIVLVRPARRQFAKSVRKRQREAISTACGMKKIQAPERAQLVFEIAKALRNLERLRERLAHFGSLGCRCAERGVQPHFVTRVAGASGSECAKRLLGATAALLQERQACPEGDGRGGQSDADRPITAGRKGPVERRA